MGINLGNRVSPSLNQAPTVNETVAPAPSTGGGINLSKGQKIDLTKGRSEARR